MKVNLTQEYYTSRVQFGNYHSITTPFASDTDKAAGREWTLPGTKKLFLASEIQTFATNLGYGGIFESV